jgi:hypothetical protein
MEHEEEIRGIFSNSLHADAVERNNNLPDFPRVSGLNRYLSITSLEKIKIKFWFLLP